MAHEITVREDGTAEMAYAGELPWHGLGQGVADAMTSEEAITLAHLDWLVETGPLYGPDGKTLVKQAYCTYRTDTGDVLGVGRCEKGEYRYLPWQNHEAFAFMDSLVQDGIVLYESAGSLFGGQQVFMLARLADDWAVRDDVHRSYILVNVGHDIAHTIKITPTDVRVVCNNTLQMALAKDEATVIDKIFHRATMHTKLGEAKEILNVTTESTRRLKAFLEKAAKVKADKMFEPVMRTVLNISEADYPDLTDESNPVQIRAKMDAFLDIYNEERARNGATAYSLVNAVTGYVDHGLRYQGGSKDEEDETVKAANTLAQAERRFTSIERGRASDLKTQAVGLIKAAVLA